MYDALRAIILGIIEGLTEFLPVSSTGHMILAKPLLGVDDADPKWAVFLFVSQIGAILAVVVYFWRDLWRYTFRARRTPWVDYVPTKLAVALLPSVLLGLVFNDVMEAWLETGWFAPYAVAGALILGAFFMEAIDRLFRRRVRMTVEEITLRQALFIGLAQCLAMWPGTSRAMATIMAGILVGLPARVAAEFSFLLAIPTMLLAGGYRLWKYRADLSSDSLAIVLLGSAVAFATALVVVSAFLTYIRRHRFTPFAVYRIVLGTIVLLMAARAAG